MLTEEEQEVYDKIMVGGYGTIMVAGNKLMITGDIEVLKNILMLPPSARRKSREEHMVAINQKRLDILVLV